MLQLCTLNSCSLYSSRVFLEATDTPAVLTSFKAVRGTKYVQCTVYVSYSQNGSKFSGIADCVHPFNPLRLEAHLNNI
jgi:hypothetical protein